MYELYSLCQRPTWLSGKNFQSLSKSKQFFGTLSFMGKDLSGDPARILMTVKVLSLFGHTTIYGHCGYRIFGSGGKSIIEHQISI